MFYSKKSVDKCSKHGFNMMSLSGNSGKEKEGHAVTVFEDTKGLINIDLLEKRRIVNNNSYCQLLMQYFTLFIE